MSCCRMILTPAAKMFEEVAIYMLITTKSAAASCMGQDRMRLDIHVVHVLFGRS